MPTGYTAGIEDGSTTTLAQFALLCARAFGALLEMRDLALNAPIPEFKPSMHAAEMLADALEKRRRILALSQTDCEIAAQAENLKCRKDCEESNRIKNEHRDRYRTMRAKVMDWIPPTKDHEGLKKFMLEQIDLCMGSQVCAFLEYSPRTGAAWQKETLASLDGEIRFYAKKDENEIKRVREQNEWVRTLRESLRGAE